MAYEPVGVERLAQWASWLKPAHPVVAIGGISLERAQQVAATGVDSIAVVSALTQAADPRAAAAAFRQWLAA
jgi:hydroxymethylpyrimidine kinase/phosphomethylpyrimidine kinase/thiamine-phosphate diphosphorylase